MALIENPDCTLWKEVTSKEQRNFAFKMLNIRRAQSGCSSLPSLSTVGSLNGDKRKTFHWRSSITAMPAPQPAPNVSRDDLFAMTTGSLRGVRSNLGSTGFSDAASMRSTICLPSRPPPFLASWGDRAAPPGGPDFKQTRR
eukprot:TRINITY_DN21297_c0_g1_i1.p1 TRINITY_DN21297_c0_g1~~TRINITY_DN21297_c0_g1_i1.p1  ORF type:complete len:141 (-),score=19.64 TRINITY_DN21297_c0_g1_i1:69-491(-)